MSGDTDRFLARFRTFGAEPSVATYLALFDPAATLFDSGMERPITVPEIPEHIEAILNLAPDFRMTPERWRRRGPTLFVEAHNQATLRDQLVAWPSVYVMDLRGDRVIRGRRYYDRRPLVSRVFPSVPPEPPFAFALPPAPHLDATTDPESFVRTRSASLKTIPRSEPQASGEVHRARTRTSNPPQPKFVPRSEPQASGEVHELQLLAWAGDPSLLFLEWRARGEVGAKPIEFGIAERFDLGTGRSYFDTLALSPA